MLVAGQQCLRLGEWGNDIGPLAQVQHCLAWTHLGPAPEAAIALWSSAALCADSHARSKTLAGSQVIRGLQQPTVGPLPGLDTAPTGIVAVLQEAVDMLVRGPQADARSSARSVGRAAALAQAATAAAPAPKRVRIILLTPTDACLPDARAPFRSVFENRPEAMGRNER